MGAEKVQEVTVTTSNQMGTMGRVFSLIAGVGVNVKSFIAYVMSNQGIFKLIASDSAKVAEVMENAGYTVEMTYVAAVTCSDAIGTGADLGKKLGDAGISVDYTYATGTGTGEAVIVFAVDDVDKAIQVLG